MGHEAGHADSQLLDWSTTFENRRWPATNHEFEIVAAAYAERQRALEWDGIDDVSPRLAPHVRECLDRIDAQVNQGNESLKRALAEADLVSATGEISRRLQDQGVNMFAATAKACGVVTSQLDERAAVLGRELRSAFSPARRPVLRIGASTSRRPARARSHLAGGRPPARAVARSSSRGGDGGDDPPSDGDADHDIERLAR